MTISQQPVSITVMVRMVPPLQRLASTLIVAGLLCCMSMSAAPASPARTVHVFVALADNAHQGIVPVPAQLGNGLDAKHNLYWGAAAGVRTFFARSSEWQLVQCGPGGKAEVIERCVFRHRSENVYFIADAYRGDAIKDAIVDFFNAAAGAAPEPTTLATGSGATELAASGRPSLVVYVGHDGLMDFKLPVASHSTGASHPGAIILACASKQYFAQPLRGTGASPLLWTTGLMAPEAYTLKSALDGWIRGETAEQIRERAAAAYDRYQKCGLRAARRLFATGW